MPGIDTTAAAEGAAEGAVDDAGLALLPCSDELEQPEAKSAATKCAEKRTPKRDRRRETIAARA